MPLITAKQMRELEQAAVRAGASEQELMEAAGLAAAQEAWMAAGAVEGRALLVLVGPGNNGGDGLVAARHLSEMGAQVGIYMLAARDDDDPLWRTVIEDDIPATGVAVDDEVLSNLESMLRQSSLVLDALLGTGASRPIEGDLAKVMGRLREARERELPPQLIALDVPTGVDSDTGHVDPAAVVADSTLAFGFSKVGLFTMPGRSYAGRVVPIDIGLPAGLGADLPYDVDEYAVLRAQHDATYGHLRTRHGKTCHDKGHRPGDITGNIHVEGLRRRPGGQCHGAHGGIRLPAALHGDATDLQQSIDPVFR